ncbi:DUF3347 domain-containing protein [Gynurincola endophyticus]|uniref:DUF3347 domain-containing protein n=1 Tax=Gynurincola endophyticus TaxID=2479004 RepID=UPI000F8EF999|nr:DUF3347 domain-containing protein [Gynurincola endophyticus]
MKSINILIAVLLLCTSTITAQIRNAATATVKIYGNCEICENTIEKAGNIKKQASVNWDKDSKLATVIFDSTITSSDDILKRIAIAGYDSDVYLAPDKSYASLPDCCRYERVNKTASHQSMKPGESHSVHTKGESPLQQVNPLYKVFEEYFAVKDALVKADESTASAKAKDLDAAVNSIKMSALAENEHEVFMKVMKDISFDAEHIGDTKDVGHQRDHFTSLSKNIYELLKITKFKVTVYYQHCPMFNNGKGANWLSKENTIKNPYYGAQMLTCGKTVETIQQ